jgi:hypothetical protein
MQQNFNNWKQISKSLWHLLMHKLKKNLEKQMIQHANINLNKLLHMIVWINLYYIDIILKQI